MQKSQPKKAIHKKQSQKRPGLDSEMDPVPKFSDPSPGSNKLFNAKCIITGGDSGIGRAVAVAFAKEGADVAIIYLKSEQKDAEFTADFIETSYQKKCLLVTADISKENNCKKAI